MRLTDLTAMRTVIEIADKRSFSLGAKALGISAATATRIIREVEAQLGCSLFLRNTRRVELTEAGAEYLAALRGAMTMVADAENRLRRAGIESERAVSLATPPHAVVPDLARCLQQYRSAWQDVQVTLCQSHEFADLLADRHDIAVRLGGKEVASFESRLLGQIRLGLFASKGYLAAHGTPTSPADLEKHRILALGMPDDHAPLRFGSLPIAQRPMAVPVLVADDLELLRASVLAGAGILQAPDLVFRADLKAGRVVRLLERCEARRLPVRLMIRKESRTKPHVKALFDLLAETIHIPNAAAAESLRERMHPDERSILRTAELLACGQINQRTNLGGSPQE